MGKRVSNAMVSRRVGATALLIAACASSSMPLRAAPSKADLQRADELFAQAMKLMKAENYDEACPLFAQSQSVAPGSGTILNLALCHEGQGKTATAYAEFEEALKVNEAKNKPDRVKKAKEHLAALKPLLSTIRIDAPPALFDDPSFELELDSQRLSRDYLATEHVIDPGPHTVEARAAGKNVWRQTVTVGAESDHKRVDVPALESATPIAPVATGTPVPSASASAAVKPPPPPPKPESDAAPSEHHGSATSTTAIVGYSMIGVSVAAAVVATYFYVQADSAQYDAQAAHAANPHLFADLSPARAKLDIARIGYGVTAGALATGAVLVLVSLSGGGESHAPKTTVSMGLGSISLRGSF
jgi:hypothetical protein